MKLFSNEFPVKGMAMTSRLAILMVLVGLTVSGCKSSRSVAKLPAPPPIDSLGDVKITRSRDTIWRQRTDTTIVVNVDSLWRLIMKEGQPGNLAVSDGKVDSLWRLIMEKGQPHNFVVSGGKFISLPIPRPPEMEIRETVQLQQDVYKENLARVNQLAAQLDSVTQLLTRQQEQQAGERQDWETAQRKQHDTILQLSAKIDHLLPYRNVIWWSAIVLIGGILVAASVKVFGWKFGGIFSLVGRIFKAK